MSAKQASMDRDTHDSNQADQSSTLERLGLALREARQRQGIERAALASKLHMGEEQLTALENADLSRLPEPVFVIAQARRVADALGMDVSQLVAPLKSNPSQTVVIGTATPPGRRISGPSPTRRGPQRPTTKRGQRQPDSPLRPLALLALLAGLVAAGVWVAPRWSTLSSLGLSTITSGNRQLKPSPKPQPVRKPAVVPGLVLRSQEPSWLEVRQGETALFKGTFSGKKHFPLQQPLRLLAGRPDLVKISVDGSREQPLGKIDDIRWVTLQPGKPFQPVAGQNASLKPATPKQAIAKAASPKPATPRPTTPKPATAPAP